MRYELDDCEWGVIKPIFRTNRAAFPACTTGVSSMASSGSCGRGAVASLAASTTVSTPSIVHADR